MPGNLTALTSNLSERVSKVPINNEYRDTKSAAHRIEKRKVPGDVFPVEPLLQHQRRDWPKI